MKPRIWMTGVGLCLLLGGAWPACGADYYVDDASNTGDLWTPVAIGNDANDGLTPTTPKATLGNLIGTVALTAGDTVYVDTGSYGAGVVISNTVVGAAGNPVWFRGSTNGVVFSGSGVILTLQGQHVRISDFRTLGGSEGLRLSGAQNCIVERLAAITNTSFCVNLADANAKSNLFRNCLGVTVNGNAFRAFGSANSVERSVWISAGSVAVQLSAASVVSNFTGCLVAGRFGFANSTLTPQSGSRNMFWDTLPGADMENVSDLHRLLPAWQGNTMANPLFANAEAYDYHLKSPAGFVSNGAWVVDAGAPYSPAIDFGPAGAPVGDEPSPNGGRLNAGMYGGTEQASKSRTDDWLFAMSYNGGGSLIQTGRLEWVGGNLGAGALVNLQYSTNRGGAWIDIATNVLAADESYLWTPATSHPAVFWRVVSRTNPAVASTNARLFSVRTATNTTFTFYANDNSPSQDVYCNALGNSTNTGIASNSPLPGLYEILTTFDLEGGDVVYLDTGNYVTPTVTNSLFDSGRAGAPVRILGSTNGTTLSRGSTLADVLDISGASHLVMENLRLADGRYGLVGTSSADITLRNMQFTGNRYGVNLSGAAVRHTFERCLAVNNTEIGFYNVSTSSRSNFWFNGVLWGNPTVLYARTNNLAVSNSILGNGTTLLGSQVVPGGFNVVWNVSDMGTHSSFTALQDAGAGWSNSLYADPLFCNATNGDFHVRSSAGRWDTNLAAFVATDTNDSPAIDFGDPAAAVAAEPPPNGSRLNVGLFGGTEQASKSRTNAWIQLASYLNGGTLDAQAGAWMRWNAGEYEPGATVTIWLSRDNGASWEALATNAPAADGHYYYQDPIADDSSSREALLRVELNDAVPPASSQSPTNFIYRNGTFAFYVNDDSQSGDVYCSALGSDANSGSSAGAPMRNLHALLNKLGQLGPGDRIYVDTGVYAATNAVRITAPFSGSATNPVVIAGSTNRLAGGSLFQSSGAQPRPLGFDVQPGVSNLVLRDLAVGYVARGVAATNVVNVTLDGVEVRGATSRAFDLQFTSRSNRLVRCVAHGGAIGLYLNQASNVVVSHSIFWENTVNAAYLGAVAGLNLENSVLASTATNAALVSLAATNLFVSDYNGIHAGPFTRVGENRTTGAKADDLAAWQRLTGGQDVHSIPGDPQLADPTTYDYHLKTKETLGRRLPNGQRTTDSVSSPLLDAGNPATPLGEEPEPNGSRVNIGKYGGTWEASIAVSTPWLLAASFADAGSVSNAPVSLIWTAGGGWTTQTVSVGVSVDGGKSWTNAVATGVPATNGLAVWDPSGLPDTPAGVWRVVCESDTNVWSKSTNFFAIRKAPLNLYVATADTNEAIYASGPAAADNWMATSNAPLNSLRAVFDRFDLEAGDQIWVDTGTYEESEAIRIWMKDSGTSNNPVRVTGNALRPYEGTVLKRASRTLGAYVVQMLQSDGLAFSSLMISNAFVGIHADNGGAISLERVRVGYCVTNAISAGANTRLELRRSILEQSLYNGLQANTGSVVKAAGNLMRDNGLANVCVRGGDVEVKNSVLEADGSSRHVYYFAGSGKLDSDYNNVRVSDGANVGGGIDRPAARFLIDWQISTAFSNDVSSFGHAADFADPAVMDFHPKSAYGRYDPVAGAYVTNDSTTSRLIDLGTPTGSYADYANEPADNGGRVNVGLYGNTAEASKSPPPGTGRIVPLTMSDGGTVRDTVQLHWAYNGLAGSNYVLVSFSGDGGVTWTNIGRDYINAGSIVWATTNVDSTAMGVWRVQLESDTNVYGQTETLFAVKNEPLAYYINDGSTLGDVFCDGMGRSTNSGLSAAAPLNSLATLLGRYKVEHGDTVYVDTGVYPLGVPLVVSVPSVAPTNYLVIQGSWNEKYGGSVFTNSGSDAVLDLQNSQKVELRDLRLHGGGKGLLLTESSSNLFRGVRAVGTRGNGFELGLRSDQNQFIQCAALNFFRTGVHVVVPPGSQIPPVTNHWISGVIASVPAAADGTAVATGALVGVRSGRLFASNSVFVASGPAHVVFDAAAAGFRGDYNAYHRSRTNLFAQIDNSGVLFGVRSLRIGNLHEWQAWNPSDGNSLEADPLFADLAGGDLHPRSAGGRYDPATSNFVADAETSPLIDLADPATAFGAETAPNGNRANLGVYGGTEFASRTPDDGTFVLLNYNHGGIARGATALRWAARGAAFTTAVYTVDISISTNSGATYQTVGSSLPALAGTYAWDSTLQPSLPTIRWRVQCREKLDWVTASERDFAIHNTNLVFYVNDAWDTNDVFTAAPGAAANTGLTPDSPLPTLAAVLARYDLEPGDEVRIDAGSYAGSAVTEIDYLDSGTDAEPVVIRGSPAAARTRFLGAGIRIENARGVHLQDLRFDSPAGAAIALLSAEGIRVERTDVLGGNGDGVNIQYCSNATLRNLLVAYAATNGISCVASYDTRVEFGTLWSNGAAQVLVRNIPSTGGSTNYNQSFAAISNCVMGAFGVRKPALEVRGNLFSDYNGFFLANGALAALSYTGGFGREFDSVGTWSSSEFGQDGHSLSHDPLFADARNGDFHLKSQGGRWVPASGSWTNDDVSSPLIDAGDPLLVCTEPDDNGGRANVGRFGNTTQASRTPTNGALTLISFNDGGRASGSAVEILWNARGAMTNGGTVSIWYSADGGNNWTLLTNDVAAADNVWIWDSTLSEESVQAYLRLVGSDGSVAQSTGFFSVRNSPFFFYVNDDSRVGDVYCGAIGSVTNTGVSSNSPLLDLNALLARYDLEGGDVVYIDTGVYRPSVPWRITQADSAGTLATNPVVFQGSTNSLVNGTVVVRNFQSVGIQADYAIGIRLRNIAVSNTAGNAVAFNNCYGASAEWMALGVGNVGFYLNGGTQLGISNCVAFNFDTAVHVANWDKATNTVFPVIQHNVFWDTAGTAIQLSGQNQATVQNNVLSVKPGQYVYGLGSQDTLFADYNAIWLGAGGRVFRKDQSRDVSPVPIVYDSVGAWASASGQDLHSFDSDPLLVDVTNRLFQLRSRAGRWTSGTNWVADDVTSPLIDAGTPESTAWQNEPAPNGGRVNIGLYGGTPWASKSDTNSSLHLLTLNRGGVASGQVALNWTAVGAATGHTVRIEVSLDNGATWPILVAAGIAADLGGVVWNSSGQGSSPLALWRVVDETDPAVSATSELNFVLKNGPVYYYVNDESQTGDVYTDAVGSSTNSGASPLSPKRWISEIVAAYNLEAGDVVYVDTGRYQMSAPTTIGDLDAGGVAQDPAEQVSIVGSSNRAEGGSRIIISDPESSAFQLEGTYGIRLSQLDILGASNGVAINDSFFVGADGLTIQDGHNGVRVQGLSSNLNVAHCALVGNRNAGILFEVSGLGAMDLGSSVLWSNRYGVYLGGGYLRTSNSIFGMVRPNSFGVYVKTDVPVYGFQGNYNSLYVGHESAAVGGLQTGAGVSARTSVYASVSTWALATGQEGNSLAHDPLLANPGAGDFHLLSRGGRYLPGGGWTNDLQTSPLIDAGHPQSLAWTAEPDPNGRRLNIGLYGGTAEASKTPMTGSLTLISPNDGGRFSGTFPILWMASGAATNYTVCIEYSPTNKTGWTNVVCGWPAATGRYDWNSVPYGRSALAYVYIYCQQDPTINAVCQTNFMLANGGTIPYYVNDASTNGDVFCSAVGDDTHHGLTPDQPKASLQAILDAYELSPEDVVYVDAGTYSAGSPPISINKLDSGYPVWTNGIWTNLYVTIQGSTNPAARTVFQAPSFGSPCVFSLDYAEYVRLKDLTLRNAIGGINAFQTIGCEFDGVRLENNRGYGLSQSKSVGTRLVRSVLWNNGTATGGVAVALSDSSIAIENSVLWGSLTAVSIGSSTLTATNNVMEANGFNGRIYQFGINANAATGFRGDYNDYYRRNGALLAEQALLTGGNDLYNNLPAWNALNGSDRHSMTIDPEFANAVNGDFHPKSSGGRYVAASGSWTNDMTNSPLVDAGPLDWPVGNEPAPNGNVVNLGAYGGTAQASMARTNPWLKVISYDGEGVMSGDVLLYWLHGGMPGDAQVRLEYSTDYQLTWTPIASNLMAASRGYTWGVQSLPLSLGLSWRVVYQSDTNVWDYGDPVVVKPGTYEYFVNDGVTTNDVWCGGPGLSIEAGANPTNRLKPINSLADLFANYPVSGGDVVYVDTGSYVLPAGTAVTIGDRNMGTSDNPLRIYGSTNFAAGGARLIGNAGANGIHLLNTRHVEIYDLRIDQAQNGVLLQNVSSARLVGMELFRNQTNGLAVLGSSGVRVENGRFWANRQYGYYCGGNGGDQILNSTFWGNGRGALRTGKAVTVSNSILSVTSAVPVYLEETDSANVTGDYNFYGLVPGAKIATNTFETVAYANLSQWQVKGRDWRSVVADPLFVDPANGNFQLQSRAGYWSNGVWAVSSNTSWAIDAGPSAPAVSNEPAPNGDRLNLGAFGGTFRASLSDTNNPGILLTTFRDGGTSADGQPLYWLYRGLSPTNRVWIEYSPDNGLTWRTVSDGWPIDGAPYLWYSLEEPSPEAQWRIGVVGATNGDVTPISFIFRPRALVYYVNDGNPAGDVYTLGPGAATNRGYTADSPLPSIEAVLNRFVLAPGDEVRVDTGLYPSSNGVVVTVLNSGNATNRVLFRGSTNWGAGGSTLVPTGGANAAAFTLYGARYVDVSNFRLAGFSNGLAFVEMATRCTAADVDVQGATAEGVQIARASLIRLDRVLVRESAGPAVAASQSQPIVLDGCVLWSNRSSAIYFGDGVAMEITNSVLEASGPGKYCYESPTNPVIRADYNNLVISSTAQVAAINGIEYPSLPQWVKLYEQDRYSLNADPLFHDPANGDFHLRSVAGRYQPGVGWTNDVPHAELPDFSPLIDMGKPQSAWSNEPAPRGNRINIGLYGNTPQASKSNTNRWLQAVTAMSGGLMYGNVNLVWGYGGGIDSNEIAWLEYSPRDGEDGTWIQIAETTVGSGQFWWNSAWTLNGVEVFRTSPQARWRLFLRDSTNVLDVTERYFGLRNSPFKYYVNDASTDGDVYCTRPGNDDNYGFDVDIPKLTLQELLGVIDLEPTDHVYVDTGLYEMADTNNPIVWGSGDSGAPGQAIEVFGSPNGSWFDAPSDFAPIGSDRAFFFLNGSYVNLRHLRFRGESLIFRGNGLVVSNVVVTNRAGGFPVSLRVRGDGIRLRDLQIDRGALTLSGLSNRVERMRQRWGETEIVGTNATLVNSAILTTNANRTGIVVNAAYSIVSNCTVLATRGTAVGKLGAFTLRLGHSVLVAGGTNDSNAVIAWTDGDLLSDWNNYWAENTAWLGIRHGKWEKLEYWKTASGQDANSVSFDPKFQNRLTGDLHLNSAGGRWSPIRFEAGMDPWDYADTETSPLVDLGNPWIGAGAEASLLWGYRLNLGAYAGTDQASKSLTNFWLTALSHNDGGVVKGSNVVLRWAAGNVSTQATVALQYSTNSVDWVAIATGQPTTVGYYEWDTTGLDGFNVWWRVVAEDGSGVADATDGPFAVRNTAQNFYVGDDDIFDNVFCFEPGSAAFDGLTPNTPKASLQQILDQYDLEGGDVVYVDTGTFTADADIRVNWSRSGNPEADVVVQGNPNSPYATALVRSGPTNFPAIGLDVKASYFQLRDLNVRGIDRAVRLESNRNATVRGVVLSDSALALDVQGAAGTEIRNSGFWKTGIGINLQNTRTSVLENLTFARSAIAGIQLENTVVDTLQNNVFIPEPEAFAYSIGVATSLLAQAYMDYNVYDFSASGSGFYAGASNVFAIPETDPLRPWQLGMMRDYRSYYGPAELADVGEYSWPPDLHPVSSNGRWVATSGGGDWTFADTNVSWAVDHGNPDSDFSLEPDVNGGRINVGMYGNTVQASQGNTNAYYEIRSLDAENLLLQGVDLNWPMIWSAHMVDGNEMVRVEFSNDGGLTWILLAIVPAYQEYYLWTAGIESQTDSGRWRVVGNVVDTNLVGQSQHDFTFIPIPFGIRRSPYNFGGLMRFDWQGGLPGKRYQIRYSDDFGKTWNLWEAKYNGPAPINMSDFSLSTTATNYIFEDRTSYLKRQRWYRIDPYVEPEP